MGKTMENCTIEFHLHGFIQVLKETIDNQYQMEININLNFKKKTNPEEIYCEPAKNISGLSVQKQHGCDRTTKDRT